MEGRRPLVILGIFLAVMLGGGLYIWGHHPAVLTPHGQIASKERRLIIESTLLMLIVVVPVYILLFAIAWRYREGNTKARYTPDWDGNRALEVFWWAVPATIITILGVITYRSSHKLDPFKSLSSNTQPITIQVVALQWKWLFIYPQQSVASVNSFHFPVNTPVNFQITADAPMNSFWIPQLGGQIYAMSGMSSELHLDATDIGTYHGLSANISGRGFANMGFRAVADSKTDFYTWLAQAKLSANQLDVNSYNHLAQPSENVKPELFASAETGLFSKVVQKYSSPSQPLLPNTDNFVASRFGGEL